MKKICVVGLGNMGKAIFEQLSATPLSVGQAGKYRVIGCGPDDDHNKMIGEAEVIIVAVKPQSFDELCQEISVEMSEKLVISIMAGVGIAKIQNGMKAEKVVRSMPNLPLKVGKGLTGWLANTAVNDEEKNLAREIFKVFGEEIELTSEDQINPLTALSGCGPAYYYYLNQIIKKAAVKYGFNEIQAKKIAVNTFLGSAALLVKSEYCSSELKDKVASKGGSTERALKYMEEHGLEELIHSAIDEARKRADELSN